MLTESWAENNLYCPNCLRERVSRQLANAPVKDFLCERCFQSYQLKSQQSRFGTSVTDAAYGTFLSAVNNGNAPNLVLLHYDMPRLRVIDLDVVPSFFLNPSCIIPRKPLPPDARRAGWIGCKISLERLPRDARVGMVRDETIEDPKTVQGNYRKFASLLLDKPSEDRSWASDVLRCVKAIGKKNFTLQEVYAFDKELKKLHPKNTFIQAKIRQQLQVLRDSGIVRFTGGGRYELI